MRQSLVIRFTVTREKRIKILQQLIYNKLKNFPPEFTNQHTFNLGLILGKSHEIVKFLEDKSTCETGSEDRMLISFIEKSFKYLTGGKFNLRSLR